MQSTLYFVTEKKHVFKRAQRFFAVQAPEIKLVHKLPAWAELQSLEEERVIEHKTLKAWEKFEHPLLVEDVGFYFKRYPNYPGTLSEFAISGLAREGLNKLCRVDNAASMFCWLGYIGQKNADCYFNTRMNGYIMDEFAPTVQTDFDIDLIFHPEGATKTLHELNGNEKEAKFSPQLQAYKRFIDWFQEKDEGK